MEKWPLLLTDRLIVTSWQKSPRKRSRPKKNTIASSVGTRQCRVPTVAKNPTPEQTTLYKLLVTLIEVYEAENYAIDKSEPHEILQHIMESKGLRQADLVDIMKSSSGVVSEVVNGKRTISKAQAKALGDYFQVSPSLFI